MKLKNHWHRIILLSSVFALIAIVALIACSNEGSYSNIQEEVIFTNPTDGAILAGTFSKLSENGIFPAVILISGSGLQDRDETINDGHKPFKVLAKHLTKQGIAVLRFDDRGAGKSKGDVWNATIEVFASDALAGINYLKSRKDVNPNQIGIIGHSQGAMEGMMLASGQNDIAFLVMLGGPGIPWAENMVEANAENLRLQGKSQDNIDAGSQLLNEMIPVMQAGADYESTKTKLFKVISEWKQSLSGEVKGEIEDFDKSHPGFWKTMASDYATPIYMSAVNFIPSQYLKKVSCPVLSIIGNKDIQVLSSLNNPAIKQALIQGGNNNHMVLEMPDINHVFQKCKTGLTSEYSKIDESFNEDMLELIADWILDKNSKQNSFIGSGESFDSLNEK